MTTQTPTNTDESAALIESFIQNAEATAAFSRNDPLIVALRDLVERAEKLERDVCQCGHKKDVHHSTGCSTCWLVDRPCYEYRRLHERSHD